MRPFPFHVFAISCIGAAAAAAPLELPNPGFEEGLAGWEIRGDAALVQACPEAASLGSKGLRVNTRPGSARFEIESAPLPVKPGETYTASFWGGAGEGGTSGVLAVSMIFKDPAGKVLPAAAARIRKWHSAGVRSGREFENPLLAAAAPPEAAFLVIQIAPSGKSTGGSVDLDDFRMEELGEVSAPKPGPDGAHPIPPSDPVRTADLLSDIERQPLRRSSPPKIVLKLDDLKPWNGKIHPKWLKVANLAKTKNIKISFGIVADGLEPESPEFFQWVKERQAEGAAEFWNHGYTHGDRKQDGISIKEFSGEPYEIQKEHMTKSNRLAREKLGFAFVSFGAPFNATDESTAKVLAEDSDIKVWLYGRVGPPAGKIVLQRSSSANLENPTFIPNYAAFLEGYAHNRHSEYFVLQGHPMQWNEERFEQFSKTIDFLIDQNCVFLTPSELAASLRAAQKSAE